MVDRASYRRMVPSGYGNFSNDIPGCDCSSCAASRGVDLVNEEGEAEENEDENEDGVSQLAISQPSTQHADQGEHDIGKVSEAELCLTPPTVYGFSFVTKDWGQLLVENFKEVEYDSNAFDHLVLEQGNKDIIRALVESAKSCSAAALCDVTGSTCLAMPFVSFFFSTTSTPAMVKKRFQLFPSSWKLKRVEKIVTHMCNLLA